MEYPDFFPIYIMLNHESTMMLKTFLQTLRLAHIIQGGFIRPNTRRIQYTLNLIRLRYRRNFYYLIILNSEAMSTCQHLFKPIVYSFTFLVASFSLVGCGNNSPAASQEVSPAQVQPANVTTENDKQFLVRAVEMKFEQILLGKLAQTRSSSDEVKELAKMLENANRETKSSLASLGIIKSIAVPSVPTKSAHDAYDLLNQSTIEEFDFSYVRFAIQGYNDAIAHFENATNGNLDPDIKSRALGMLPDMRNHLLKAKELDARMNPVSELIR